MLSLPEYNYLNCIDSEEDKGSNFIPYQSTLNELCPIKQTEWISEYHTLTKMKSSIKPEVKLVIIILQRTPIWT